MKLATWNIWWRFGAWDERRPAIESVLQALDADVIGLQEVWHDDERSYADTLATDLGYHVAFAPSPAPEKWQRRVGDDTFGIGNAVLSRWPIRAGRVERLPAGDAPDEGRVVLHTEVDTPHGTLPFACTHLNSGWGQSSIRRQQLRRAGEVIHAHPPGDFPAVLCGDFNATPDFDEVRAFAGKSEPLVAGLVMWDAWSYLDPHDPGFTWDRTNPYVEATHEPSGRIDYLFVSPPSTDGRGKPIRSGLFGTHAVDGVWPSDHFGVWVDIHA